MKPLNEREQGLLKAREMYGEEVENALREYLEIIDEKLYLWIAGLYKPRKCVCNNFDSDGNRVCLLPKDEKGNCLCSGGGFYYSNSARDTEGYEIDIESTAQAILFLKNSGMLRAFDDDYIKAFPKQFALDVCAFTKSLQNSDDGFFYHPQWGKNIKVSRRGRDLTWATMILSGFNDTPLYDTLNGKRGTLGAPNEMKREGAKKEQEQVVIWPDHLKTLDAFKEYLSTFDMKKNAYSAGNTLSSQKQQIIERDRRAVICGEAHDNDGDGIAEDGYVDALKRFVEDTQNSENGLWSEEVSYGGVNGLMKILCAIDGKLNYAERSFKSAMEIAMLPADAPDSNGKITEYSVEVYNAWVAIRVILNNVKKYGTSAEYERLMGMLRDNASVLIKACLEKVKRFKKNDGSFGYTMFFSPPTSQGATVCPEGVIEGDMNGGTIATIGVFSYMTATLGLKIPIYLPEDFERFIEKINEKYS